MLADLPHVCSTHGFRSPKCTNLLYPLKIDILNNVPDQSWPVTVQSTLKSKSYLFSRWTCGLIHVWRETFSSEQSNGKNCKHPLTHPCPSRGKVTLCPLRVGERWVEPGSKKNLNASEECKDCLQTYETSSEATCMWWETRDERSKYKNEAKSSSPTNVRGFVECAYRPNYRSWLYVHQKHKSKINHAKLSPCKGNNLIPKTDGLAGNNPTTL